MLPPLAQDVPSLPCAWMMQSAAAMNHTSPDGRFVMELNNGDTWILYSSDPDMEFFYVPAQPNDPNK